MNILFWVLVAFTVLLFAFMQLSYAKANYPSLRQWKILLLTSGCVEGVLAATALFRDLVQWRKFVVWCGVVSLVFIITNIYLFPHNMQYIYPKRQD